MYHPFFSCHFADLEQEIKPITSGLRLAVVYYVIWSGSGQAPSSHFEPTNLDSLRDAILGWDRPSSLLAYGLEHQYTEAGVAVKGFAALKGQDFLIGQALVAANQSLPTSQQLRCHLAFASRENSYYGDGDYYDRYSDWTLNQSESSIDRWYSHLGQELPEWILRWLRLEL